MKQIFAALGLTILFSVAIAAQNQQKAAGVRSTQSASSQANGGAKTSSLSGAANLQAALQNTLDVKNAKVGDQIVMKTTQAVKQNGQVVIAKGSTLIGHVTDVQRRAGNGSASRLGLVFDTLQGGSLSTPITATINSISNVRTTTNAGDDLSTDVMGSNSTSARSSSGSNSGGGLLGGVTKTAGGVLNSTTQTVGGVANTSTGTVGSTTRTVGGTINGIQISTSASGSAQTSTTLSSQISNLRLEKGATFNMTVQKNGGN